MAMATADKRGADGDVVARTISAIARSKDMNAGVLAMRRRQREMGGRLTADLAGAAVVPAARRMLEDAILREWKSRARRAPKTLRRPEVVVGPGLHGSIYAAARAAAGLGPVLVLGEDPGGIFALTESASWYLNSRNRDGRNLPPLEDGGLNHVPGSPVQLAHISMEKFHTNADLRYVIRVLLALTADVLTDNVIALAKGDTTHKYALRTASGRTILTKRVIDARGMFPGVSGADGKRVLSFAQLMRRMDGPFPLRGMSRVAVIGSGDSGKCAVEMLLGSAPPGHMSVAALDWVRQVDLYGRTVPATVEEWRASERGRYQAIGSYLRPLNNGEQRLRTFQGQATYAAAYEGAYVNDRLYDHVVVCTGCQMQRSVPELDDMIDDRPVYHPSADARFARKVGEVYQVGPRARITLTGYEERLGLGRKPELAVGLFRLGDKTAALGGTLPAK